jgi:ATP-dependent DNA helicase RecG
MRTAQDLLTELNAADESPRIEAKRSREIGKSIMERCWPLSTSRAWAAAIFLLGARLPGG